MVVKSAPKKRFRDLEADKLRGGYYTSKEVTDWLCAWAISSATDTVLEPSCGDGEFIGSLVERLMDLGASPKDAASQIQGVEILASEAKKASDRIKNSAGVSGSRAISAEDFFGVWSKLRLRGFDAVVGNPPFIRYQSFPEPSRSFAMEIMESLGLHPNRLTNAWVPFVVAAIECLRKGGRLAMVLPAELLQVKYASQLRSHLADRFERIDIITCNEMFFEKAEQEVVLLLADGMRVDGKACRVTLTESKTVQQVVENSASKVLKGCEPKSVCHDSEKWLKYFLTVKEIEFMRAVKSAEGVVRLGHHASVEVGVVTGKNAFFVVSEDEVLEHGLDEYVLPLIGRSSQLRGAKLTKGEWQRLSKAGERVLLFSPDPSLNGDITRKAKRYIKSGESDGVHEGYKCSIRKPWYSVPSIWTPGCFLFRQIYDFPRVVLNRANATSTDTIHRMRCKSSPVQVATSMYNHLTGASAEIEGRSYGGGVLELEPNEAELVLFPLNAPDALGIEECDSLIRQGRLVDILEENDRRILQQGIGLSKQECTMARKIWEKMRDRRLSRKKSKKTP